MPPKRYLTPRNENAAATTGGCLGSTVGALFTAGVCAAEGAAWERPGIRLISARLASERMVTTKVVTRAGVLGKVKLYKFLSQPD